MVAIHFFPQGISLEAKNSPIQAPSGSIIYVLDMSPWALAITGTPTILKVVDVDDPSVDLSATIMSGVCTEDSNEINCPALSSLTNKKVYRVHVNFADAINTYECNFVVRCRY